MIGFGRLHLVIGGADVESVYVDVGKVVAVIVISDDDIDVFANIGGQVHNLGHEVFGDEHAVAVLVDHMGNGLRLALFKEFHIHLVRVLAGAHLEGDEAVAAQLEHV